MILIMLGAQGTGKGTVAGILSKKTGWPQISTGDIFRKYIAEQTELGIEANKYIAAGNLVPDTITVPMVKARLEEDDAKEGAILDGFPRTIAQAEALDNILVEKGFCNGVFSATIKEQLCKKNECWVTTKLSTACTLATGRSSSVTFPMPLRMNDICA